MVVGLELFQEHFNGYEDAYALIGGTACDVWFKAKGLTFRRTKDLDIVLVIEALDQAFVDHLMAFVDAGQYQARQRQNTGRREFYRFHKPKVDGYPPMLELFAKAPVTLDLGPDQQVVPVETVVASLSAILMDKDYYELVLSNRQVIDGLQIVGVDGLIPLKARAWLDLTQRQKNGDTVHETDIKKHRNDPTDMTFAEIRRTLPWKVPSAGSSRRQLV